MSDIQLDETQKNGTQYCVLQTQLPFTSLLLHSQYTLGLALLVHSVNIKVCIYTKSVCLLLDLCLSLWVLSPVAATHSGLTFTSVPFTHTSWLLCTFSQLIQKRTDLIFTSVTYHPR